MGHKDRKVVFPHKETRGTFTVDVYTTSPLIAFRVQRSDGHSQEQQLLAEFVSYPSNSIVATYRIGIPWMKDSVSGVYTISVTNEDDESATQTVQIERAQGERALHTYLVYQTKPSKVERGSSLIDYNVGMPPFWALCQLAFLLHNESKS